MDKMKGQGTVEKKKSTINLDLEEFQSEEKNPIKRLRLLNRKEFDDLILEKIESTKQGSYITDKLKQRCVSR